MYLFLALFLAGMVKATNPSITDYWRSSASWLLARTYITQEMLNGSVTDCGVGFSLGYAYQSSGQDMEHLQTRN